MKFFLPLSFFAAASPPSPSAPPDTYAGGSRAAADNLSSASNNNNNNSSDSGSSRKARRQQQGHLQQGHLQQESFVDPSAGGRSKRKKKDYKSEYLLDVAPELSADFGGEVDEVSASSAGVRRSASSVNSGARSQSASTGRAPIAKPVRRSKSHVNGGGGGSNLVTNIQHGGPVTFVSVNNVNEDGVVVEAGTASASASRSDSFQGSHTLPRAGASGRKKKR